MSERKRWRSLAIVVASTGGLPLALLLASLLAIGTCPQSATAQSEVLINLMDPTVASVSSGPQLVAALANPKIRAAVLRTDVVVAPSDWGPFNLPIQLLTDFAISGMPGTPQTSWPTVDLQNARNMVGRAERGDKPLGGIPLGGKAAEG